MVDKKSAEDLATMWERRGYVSPLRAPEDYTSTATCKEALQTAAALRDLIDRAEKAEAEHDAALAEARESRAQAIEDVIAAFAVAHMSGDPSIENARVEASIQDFENNTSHASLHFYESTIRKLLTGE